MRCRIRRDDRGVLDREVVVRAGTGSSSSLAPYSVGWLFEHLDLGLGFGLLVQRV